VLKSRGSQKAKTELGPSAAKEESRPPEKKEQCGLRGGRKLARNSPVINIAKTEADRGNDILRNRGGKGAPGQGK